MLSKEALEDESRRQYRAERSAAPGVKLDDVSIVKVDNNGSPLTDSQPDIVLAMYRAALGSEVAPGLALIYRFRIPWGMEFRDFDKWMVAGDSVYYHHRHTTWIKSYLHVLNPATGAERWHMKGISPTPPTVYNGMAYVTACNGEVWAVEAESGHERWRFGFGGWFTVLAVTGNVACLSRYEGGLYALDASTGVELWRTPTPEDGALIPWTSRVESVHDDTARGVVHVISTHTLSTPDRTTGIEQWRVEGLRPWIRTRAAGGFVAVGSQGNIVSYRDALTGEERWALSGRDTAALRPLASGRMAISTNRDRSLSCLDARTGVELPHGQHKEGRWNVIYIGDEIVYLKRSGISELVAIDARTGGERWRLPEDEDCTIWDVGEDYPYVTVLEASGTTYIFGLARSDRFRTFRAGEP
ncbi:MAG: PQQ-binding-like beta-propeller repeat protein [Thermomicrobiales bacterium]